MVGHHLGAHRTKGADADMQREKRVRNALEHFVGEMKSSRWRGDRSFLLSIDRLIAFAIIFLLHAAHVMRQGELAVLLEIEWRIPTDQAVAIFKNFRDHAANSTDANLATQLHALARPNEAAPFKLGQTVEAKQLDAAIIRKHPRRNHPRVVEH